MRRRRANVDADGAQAQPLSRDIVGPVIRVVPLMTVMIRVMRMR